MQARDLPPTEPKEEEVVLRLEQSLGWVGGQCTVSRLSHGASERWCARVVTWKLLLGARYHQVNKMK